MSDPLLDPTFGGYKRMREVLAEEKEYVEDQRRARVTEAQSRQPFALAFSGGGMRAAAFQCGVLWKLAEENLLKDVELITAVSGGGYIAMAFASFCLAETENAPPRGNGDVRDWYKRVVAKTVVRMQDNAGDFVRDFGRSGCGLPTDGSGCTPLPRGFDVPILLATLLITVLVNPFFVFTSFMVPLVDIVEEFFGESMRAAFCHPGSESDAMMLLLNSKDFKTHGFITLGMTVVTFLVYAFAAVVPALKDPKKNGPDGQRVKQGDLFVAVHGLKACLVRLSIILGIFALFVFAATYVQMFAFTGQHGSAALIENYCTGVPKVNCLTTAAGCLPNLLGHITLIVLVTVICAIFVMPYLGSQYTVTIVCVGGPFFILVFLMRLVQFRVFGPLTGQDFYHHQSFDYDSWMSFRNKATLMPVLLLPFYNNIRGVLHTYYMRCLSHNFFAGGKDRPFADLKNTNYCPLVLLTGTSSDYKSPICGDEDTISELSFTPLHCGSNETGYVKQPEYRTMGNVAALSAAGCIDAVALTLSTLLTMRFWLEALNLSWGDYILFSSDDDESWFGRWVNKFSQEYVSQRFRGEFIKFMHRLPITLFVWIVWILFYFRYYTQGLVCFALVFVASFINVGLCHKEATLSPWIRQLQQAMGFTFRADHPPPMLYVTDGGCRDCTTLTQLVLRRQERILLVLAASDPNDELGVLKTAIQIIQDQQLAHFYDPDDPRRDVQSLLYDFKEQKGDTMLHLGIYYNTHLEGTSDTGHLFIVKNRLPPGFEKDVMPHLTVQEMTGEKRPGAGQVAEGITAFDAELWGGMKTDQLGPFCCCDFMHYNGVGNCGPPFPHGSFSNFMYMTPMWANSLARLAFAMSGEAIQKVTERVPRGAAWEGYVRPRGNPTPHELRCMARFDMERPRG